MDDLAASTAAPNYGISQVSGYYGPGSLAAWHLLTLSVIIDTAFSPDGRWPAKISRQAKWPSMRLTRGVPLRPRPKNRSQGIIARIKDIRLGDIDFNLLGAFAYPFVASLDLLRNLNAYSSDPELIALFDAPFIVVSEAILVFCVLFIVQNDRKDHEDFIFYLVKFKQLRGGAAARALIPVIYFGVTRFVVSQNCRNADWTIYVDYFLPVPKSIFPNRGEQQAECAVRYKEYLCGRTFSYSPLFLPGEKWDIFSPTYQPDYFLKLSRIGLMFASTFLLKWVIPGIFLPNPGHARSPGEVARYYIIGICASIGQATVGWLVLAFFVVEPLGVVVHLISQQIGLWPQTEASFMDLDQITSVLLGGALPLLWKIRSIVKERRMRRSQL